MDFSGDTLFGIVQIAASVVIFGTIFVPIKKFNAGDGVFSQWVMCIGSIFNGFIVCVAQGFPPIYPIASIGGAIWAIGNCIAIFVMRELGLGLPLLLFSVTAACIAFVTSYFGLLWTNPRPPSNIVLGLIGLAVTLIGGAMISQVKNRKPSHSSSNSTICTSSLGTLEEQQRESKEHCKNIGVDIFTINNLELKPSQKQITIDVSSSKADETSTDGTKPAVRRAM